eukprot:scaffold290973_cov36-Tisochrysis_lutea.AAC.1
MPFSLVYVLAVQAAAGGSCWPLHARWTAFLGKPSVNAFDLRGYEAMRDDERRTSAFVEAIQRQLGLSRAAGRGSVVLEIGTGPFALLALAAARAGASRVYAVEANAAVAASARAAVAAASDVSDGVIQVVEGLSTEIELPEKVDIVVAEVVGNIASEEGFVATMADARKRHAAHPSDPACFIPTVIETLCAPMSYVLHHEALGPPGFDWQRVIDNEPPPHFSCSYRGLHLLAEPQVFESAGLRQGVIESYSLATSCYLQPGQRSRSATFAVSHERIVTAEAQVAVRSIVLPECTCVAVIWALSNK